MKTTLMIRATSVAVVAAVLAGATGCSGRDDPGSAPAVDEPKTQCGGQAGAALSAWGRAGFSGAVAISKRGRFECLAGYGLANDRTGAENTADTVFGIGSVSKAVTAASILALAEAGKLRLDDKVGKLVPAVTGPASRVTIRQLLVHTGGLSGSIGEDHRPLSRAAAIAAINRLRLAFPPGTDEAYSNAGYTLLALVVEQVSGTTYRDYTRSKTLPAGSVSGGFWDGRPAAPGPRAAGYLENGRAGQSGGFQGPHWALDGNGDLAMTTRELAVWTHALFTGRVVSPASVKTITGPGYDLGGGRRSTPGWFGFDASVAGRPFLATAGGGGDVGHNVAVVWIPKGQQVIVLSSNKPALVAEKLVKTLLPSLLAGIPLPTPAVPAGRVDPAAIVGRYQLRTGGSFQVTARTDPATISAHGCDALTALFRPPAQSPGRFHEHSRRVLALLSGRTPEGRTERAALESAHGPISGLRLCGSVVRDGELRSYVGFTARGKALLGWYSVSDHGAVEASEVPAPAPGLALVPAGPNRYRPEDSAGTGPDLTVEFAGRTLTITAPAGKTVARRAG